MQSALFAFKLLSLARRFARPQAHPEQVGGAIPYFPLVGIILGLVLVFLNRLLDPRLESEILGVLLIAVLALLTGAFHYEGLQNTFDRLSEKIGHPRESEHNQALGILAIVFVVLLKVGAVEVMGEVRSLGLLLTPLFARWSLVIVLYGSASFTEGTARILADAVRAWHLALTTIITLALAFFLVGRIALWIGLCLSLFALLCRSYLRRRNGCIDFDNCGAVIELSETLSFVLFTSL